MIIEFQVDAGYLDPFARESVKRSICDQARTQGIRAYVITESSKKLSVKLEGEHGIIQAYEAAILSWFNR